MSLFKCRTYNVDMPSGLWFSLSIGPLSISLDRGPSLCLRAWRNMLLVGWWRDVEDRKAGAAQAPVEGP